MKLIGSLTSPFVRLTRVVCEELQVDYQLEQTLPFLKMNAEQHKLVNENNPLMKVPILVDGDQNILDSRIIVKYLLEKNPGQKAIKASAKIDVAEENRISVIYGIIEAGVLRFIMGSQNIDMNSGYMARSTERIKGSLDYLESDKDFGTKFGVAEIMLVCCFEWFEKRKIFDWSGYKNLSAIHQKYRDRDSFVKTRIPADL